MYWAIDLLCFLAGLAEFATTIAIEHAAFCWVGLLWICLYPFLLEGMYNFLAGLSQKVEYSINKKARIVYSQGYNITFCGIEKLHPFDSEKYGNIFRFLTQRHLINEDSVIPADKIPRSLLLQKMNWLYLLKLCYTISICSYIEMPLLFLPACLLRWRVLDPMMRASQGSILAVCSAMKMGWSVNLSGGFHHASFTNGGGFCIYPDISLAVHYLRTRLGIRRIMIVDLDAHQGNGHERDHLQDQGVFTVDFYNHYIYPDDQQAAKAIRRDVGVLPRTTDEQYLAKMSVIQQDMNRFSPEFVIYNAGTDILEGDRLGELNITAEGILARDQKMIGICMARKIPVTMLLSGGYQKVNAKVIADSIQNLLSKFP